MTGIVKVTADRRLKHIGPQLLEASLQLILRQILERAEHDLAADPKRDRDDNFRACEPGPIRLDLNRRRSELREVRSRNAKSLRRLIESLGGSPKMSCQPAASAGTSSSFTFASPA